MPRVYTYLPIFLPLLFYLHTATCQSVEENLRRLREILRDSTSSRRSWDSDNASPIWQEYEFGTGAGNRDELIVSRISVAENTDLPENATDCQYFEADGFQYLACPFESFLSFYKLNADNSSVNEHVKLSVDGVLLTFKCITLGNEHLQASNNHVAVVVCVKSDNGIYLRWYQLINNEFQFLWSRPLQKPIIKIEFIQRGSQSKLLLLDESETPGNRSLIHVCDFSIDISNPDLNSWLCRRMLLPKVFDIQVCPVHESVLLALQGPNDVLLYQYRDSVAMEEPFSQSQLIDSNDVRNLVCFESGLLAYLAISGPNASLFNFINEEFKYNKKFGLNFETGEISWIQALRLNTYRDESLLLMQLRNSTVIALAWQGVDFKRIELPQNSLDQFNLSQATVVPKFGFISNNYFVKFETKLVYTRSPIRDKSESMLQTKALLDTVVNQQESLINKIEERINSYIKNPVVTESWTFKSINATGVTITDNVNHSAPDLNAEDLTQYSILVKDLSMIEEKLHEIETNLKEVFSPDSKNITSDSDINLFGNIDVIGTLTVNNITAAFINKASGKNVLDNLISNTDRASNVSYSNETVKATFSSINGIPISNILFDSSKRNYSGIEFSKIKRLEIDGNLNASRINGIDWDTFEQNVVWKNKPANITENVIVNGTVSAAEVVVDYLNDLRFPNDYVPADEKNVVNVTGIKSIEKLSIGRLLDVQTINDIDVSDFIILNRNNTLEQEIIFEDLTVDKVLQIDGEINGVEKIQLLNETFSLSSNVSFVNLTVLGEIILEESLNDKNLSYFNDFVLKTDKNVTITGTKTFLKNVDIMSNITIESGLINGHPISEFMTVDTDQELTNLSKMSGNISFAELRTSALEKLNEFLNGNEANSTECLKKIIMFKLPVTVDRVTFDTINMNVPSEVFMRKLNETFQRVSFENLTVSTLFVEEIIPEMVNDVDLTNTANYKKEKNSTAECIIHHLETSSLNASFIGEISHDQWINLNNFVRAFYHDIFNGNLSLESIRVLGSIDTQSINGHILEDLYQEDKMGTVIFEENVSIDNLNVLGLVNNFNFSEYIPDIVLKTDKDIVITSFKTFNNITCQRLNASSLNNESLENVLDSTKKQDLTGPVTVDGVANILGNINVSGKINNTPFNQFNFSTNEFSGDIRFSNNVSITNLYINGSIQEVIFDEFLKALVYKDQDNAIISERKFFQNSVNFTKSLTVNDTLNDLDLKEFFENVIFIDAPFSVDSKLVFEDEINIEKDLVIEEAIESKTIMDIDMEELEASVIYLNRPEFIKELMTLTDVNFEANINIETLNDIDMSLLIPLHTEQIIKNNIVKGTNITVSEIEFSGIINGQDLNQIYKNTFMLLGNQTVTGHINFRGNVYARQNFDAHTINGISPKQIVQLNRKDTMIGNFVFKKPIILNKSLRVLGRLNEVDVNHWQTMAVMTSLTPRQIISGKWTVHGEVYFQNGTLESDSLNGVNMTIIKRPLVEGRSRINPVITEEQENVKYICENLNTLKPYAEHQVYKFSGFDYLQILEFDSDIVSVHYFELDDMDYLLISHGSCQLSAFIYNGINFELVANVSDFGVVHLWETFNSKNALYFVTVGNDSCGRSPGNIWKLENDEFVHVLDLGNITDSKQIGPDTFLTLAHNKLRLRSIREVEGLTEQSPVSTIVDGDDLRFVSNSDRTLVVNQQSIYEYHSRNQSVRRANNHFGTTEIIHLKVGVFEKELFLYYNEEVSDSYIFISSDVMKEKKIQQTIKAYKPTSFLILNFEDFVETLLLFMENERTLRIYEYSGVQGFVHRDSIRIDSEKLFNFKLRKYSRLAKRQCVGTIYKNRLTILEATMYGEKVDMTTLTCPTF